MPGLWRNRGFVALFSAQAISLAGSGVTTVALALLVHRMVGAGAATTILGQALMLRIVAFLLFSQPAGVLADRVNRKWLMITSDLIRFVLIALFPFITAVWQVYVAVFTVNCLTALFTPAFEASLPEVAGQEHYVKALSYSRITADVEGIAGPALAGILIVLMDVRWVFWFDAVTYLVSAVLVVTVNLPSPRAVTGSLAPQALWKDVTYGVRLLVRQPPIRQALLMSMAEALAGACAIVVTVVYVRDVLGGTEAQFSIVMAGAGLGSAAAAVLLSRITARMELDAVHGMRHGLRHRWTAAAVILGGTILSTSLLPGWLKPPLILFAFLWILNGAGQALIAIPSSTLVASHTSADERGRAFAAQFAITHACWLVSYPLVGHLAGALGPPMTFSICGITCLAITVVALVIGRGDENTHVHSTDEP